MHHTNWAELHKSYFDYLNALLGEMAPVYRENHTRIRRHLKNNNDGARLEALKDPLAPILEAIARSGVAYSYGFVSFLQKILVEGLEQVISQGKGKKQLVMKSRLAWYMGVTKQLLQALAQTNSGPEAQEDRRYSCAFQRAVAPWHDLYREKVELDQDVAVGLAQYLQGADFKGIERAMTAVAMGAFTGLPGLGFLPTPAFSENLAPQRFIKQLSADDARFEKIKNRSDGANLLRLRGKYQDAKRAYIELEGWIYSNSAEVSAKCSGAPDLGGLIFFAGNDFFPALVAKSNVFRASMALLLQELNGLEFSGEYKPLNREELINSVLASFKHRQDSANTAIQSGQLFWFRMLRQVCAQLLQKSTSNRFAESLSAQVLMSACYQITDTRLNPLHEWADDAAESFYPFLQRIEGSGARFNPNLDGLYNKVLYELRVAEGKQALFVLGVLSAGMDRVNKALRASIRYPQWVNAIGLPFIHYIFQKIVEWFHTIKCEKRERFWSCREKEIRAGFRCWDFDSNTILSDAGEKMCSRRSPYSRHRAVVPDAEGEGRCSFLQVQSIFQRAIERSAEPIAEPTVAPTVASWIE